MSRMHVGQDSLAFEDAEGHRTVVHVAELAKSGDQHGLLLWGIFTQLFTLNQTMGQYNAKERQGTGFAGMLAQQTIDGRATVDVLGRIAEAFAAIQKQGDEAQAKAPTVERAMADALELVKRLGVDMPAGIAGAIGGALAPKSGNGSGG